MAFPIHDGSAAASALPPLDAISRSILQLLANGESYDEAACILGLERDAVDHSMSALRRRLCATTDEHAVAIGLRLRLID